MATLCAQDTPGKLHVELHTEKGLKLRNPRSLGHRQYLRAKSQDAKLSLARQESSTRHWTVEKSNFIRSKCYPTVVLHAQFHQAALKCQVSGHFQLRQGHSVYHSLKGQLKQQSHLQSELNTKAKLSLNTGFSSSNEGHIYTTQVS